MRGLFADDGETDGGESNTGARCTQLENISVSFDHKSMQ